MTKKTIALTLNTNSIKALFLQQHGQFTLVFHSSFRLYNVGPNDVHSTLHIRKELWIGSRLIAQAYSSQRSRNSLHERIQLTSP